MNLPSVRQKSVVSPWRELRSFYDNIYKLEELLPFSRYLGVR